MSCSCRSCASENLKKILDLGKMPSVGGFLDSKKMFKNDLMYDLNIFSCVDCGLVQIIDAIDPDILFKNYSFSSSTVAPLIDHFKEYAVWLNQKLKPKKIFEFGCNDGVLLDHLQAFDINNFGIDISENITELAREKGHNVFTGYFNENFANEFVEKYGQVDVVTGSNAFAHNKNPEIILNASNILLNENGKLVLEVMYAGDLLEKFQWDTLYHEHLTFYSLSTLEILLKRFGFIVFDACQLPMHGGSLRVVAAKNNKCKKTDEYKKIQTSEKHLKLNDFKTWNDFGNHVIRKIDIVKNTFSLISSKYSIAAYGAAGKAAMWFNAANMNYLQYVVDSSPLRAGKFMPGTHNPIVFPTHFKDNPVDFVFISAWNYAEVISKKEDWFNGTWIVPLPKLSFF